MVDNFGASSIESIPNNGVGKSWIVILNKEHLEYEEVIKYMICRCDPIRNEIGVPLELGMDIEKWRVAMEHYISSNMKVIPTKNCKGIIVPSFCIEQFSEKWKDLCDKLRVKLKQPYIYEG